MCARHQRQLATAIKRARQLALLPGALAAWLWALLAAGLPHRRLGLHGAGGSHRVGAGALGSSTVGGHARREPGHAVRGRGRARAVSGVRARRAPVRGLAALARGREPGGTGAGLARPRRDRAHAALRGRVEPLRGTTDYGSHPARRGAASWHGGRRGQGKDGYARNYLLPKGLAYPATDANKKKIAYEAARIAKQRAAEKSAAETEATRIAEVHLTFTVKVGDEDKLFGSVTASDVQRKLEELGLRVDKRRVDLPEPIRELGEFRVGIKLHPDVRPEIQVSVVKE